MFCDIWRIINSLYTYMYMNKEMLIKSNVWTMHAMNQLHDCINMSNVHYRCDCNCFCANWIGCRVPSHILDRVSCLTHILDMVSFFDTCILDQVSRSDTLIVWSLFPLENHLWLLLSCLLVIDITKLNVVPIIITELCIPYTHASYLLYSCIY